MHFPEYSADLVCRRLVPGKFTEGKDLISRVTLGGEALSMHRLTEFADILGVGKDSFCKDLMQPLLRVALTKAHVPEHCADVVCSRLVDGKLKVCRALISRGTSGIDFLECVKLSF